MNEEQVQTDRMVELEDDYDFQITDPKDYAYLLS